MTPEQIQEAADRAEGKRPARDGEGRPTKYQEGMVEQAAKLCALGATDVEMADFFKVSLSTFYLWKNSYPEFSEAIKAAKESADSRVERSLYQRALGYSHDAVKIMSVGGAVEKVEYREHYPPDTTAAIFWLKNRKPAEWRDRQQHEHSGPDGGAIETRDVTDVDRAKAMAILATKAKRLMRSPV